MLINCNLRFLRLQLYIILDVQLISKVREFGFSAASWSPPSSPPRSEALIGSYWLSNPIRASGQAGDQGEDQEGEASHDDDDDVIYDDDDDDVVYDDDDDDDDDDDVFVFVMRSILAH